MKQLFTCLTATFYFARGRMPSLLVAWLVLLANPARATHIVGGELELEHVSGIAYVLRMNLYFDAVNGQPGALDQELTASIFDKSTNLRILNVVLPLTGNTFVNYTNPICAVPTLSTRKLVYSQTIQLPASTYNSPGGYYAVVERCCRNVTISNIQVPSAAAQTFYLEFPAVVRGGQPFYDSTPRIFPPLADYACRNELFYYDFSGTDADGDSLAYDLVTPLNGHSTTAAPKPAQAESAPYAPINWNPGLSAQNQIPGNPTLQINGRTGRLTVRPANLGLFVFGVRCAEYRRGEKIGECRRDFQLMVLNCAANRSPSLLVLPPATMGGTAPYRPGRDTLRLRPGADRCVSLRFTDPDPNSVLTLSLHPVNFAGNLPTFATTASTSGRVHAAGAPDTLTATLCFPDCLNSRGQVFLLDVIVADNGCSLPRRDTTRVAFIAVPPPNGPPLLSSTAGPVLPLHARVGDVVAFDLTGTDPNNNPLTLTMSGADFAPATVGAALTQAVASGRVQGHFTWRVTCAAVRAAPYVFTFTASATPCGGAQAATLAVPVIVDYANVAPVLTATLPPAGLAGALPPVVRLPLGGTYTATLAGTDANRDGLTMTATGQGFDLAGAGMSFAAQNGTGQASGTFHWEANCAAVALHQALTVTFTLVDATCQPLPQTRTVRFEVVNADTAAVTLYNVITPNGDRQNEAFHLPGLPPNFCDAEFANLRIFSRWGQQVYETADRNFSWGGQGTAGAYYYLVTYTDGRHYKGWLEVLP